VFWGECLKIQKRQLTRNELVALNFIILGISLSKKENGFKKAVLPLKYKTAFFLFYNELLNNRYGQCMCHNQHIFSCTRQIKRRTLLLRLLYLNHLSPNMIQTKCSIRQHSVHIYLPGGFIHLHCYALMLFHLNNTQPQVPQKAVNSYKKRGNCCYYCTWGSGLPLFK
ncbi:hypothetical protein SAMN05444350_16911, partial [Bacteroides stercorirosoris]